MREIKFRAWDKEYNCMYQNAWPFEHLVYVEMPSCDEQCNPLPINGNKFYCMNGKTFYFLMNKHVELMQYTGLKDKHGKDIFEGDILCVEDASRGTVKYGKGCFYYDDWIDGWTALEDIDTENNAIIIGNIYEHPELLKER